MKTPPRVIQKGISPIPGSDEEKVFEYVSKYHMASGHIQEWHIGDRDIETCREIAGTYLQNTII